MVFTADHGEDLYAHHFHFFHVPSVYDASLRIPLIFTMPGRLPGGRVHDTIVSILDVAPTICGLLHLSCRRLFPGHHLFSPDPDDGTLAAISEMRGQIFTIRTERWRYIWNPDCIHPLTMGGGTYPIACAELYDMRATSQEKVNVLHEYPPVAETLRQRLIRWIRQHLRPGLHPSLSPETLEELRGLGYIGQRLTPVPHGITSEIPGSVYPQWEH